jgi:hypothetical protein
MLKTKPQKPLLERIAELHAECEAWIDSKADEMAKECPSVPIGVVRNIITARATCPCQQVKIIMEQN